MKKDEYKEKVEVIKEEISAKKVEIEKLRDQYIESNKPFQKETEVSLTLSSGRKAKGKIHTYGILGNGNVYVTAYKDLDDKEKVKYISVPYQSIELLK
jgi:hypothetical protein